jgi:hypothetical protein
MGFCVFLFSGIGVWISGRRRLASDGFPKKEIKSPIVIYINIHITLCCCCCYARLLTASYIYIIREGAPYQIKNRCDAISTQTRIINVFNFLIYIPEKQQKKQNKIEITKYIIKTSWDKTKNGEFFFKYFI